MRKGALLVALPLAGLMALISACGSSTATSAPSPTSHHVSASTATATAEPTVGPTNAAASPSPKPAAIDLEIVKRNGEAIIIAPVEIQGKTYEFIVDTGATATLIDQAYATRLGLKKTKQAPISVAGVTGSAKAYLATISNWSIGRSKIPTSTITVGNLGLGSGDLVGLLGSDVLSTFGRITIDYDKQKATLG
jgi:clan AA aspartic protease (TIGR02281 family)